MSALLLASVPASADPIEWSDEWPKIDAEDYGIAAGLFLSAFATRVLIPTQNGWHGTLFFDEPIRDLLRINDPDTQLVITDISDVFQIGVAAYPIAVDALLVAGLKEENLHLAEQLLVIDAQAFGLTTFMTALSKAIIGRARPGVEPCPGTLDDFSCRDGVSRQSLVSGHSAAAFTGAGLVCVHHEHLNLYRSSWTGDVACAAGLALATITGGMRLVSDRHYASDMLAGAALGLLSGYVMPKLVHYRTKSHPAEVESRTRGQVDLRGIVGLSSFRESPEAVGGAELSVRHRFALLDLVDLDLRFGGRAIRSGQDSTEARLRSDLRLFWDLLGVGVAVDYAAERSQGQPFTALGLYPTLSLGYMEPNSMVLLSARWGRLLGEPYQEISGRIELAWLRYLSLGAEVETRVPDSRVGAMPASTRFLASVGGRLPW